MSEQVIATVASIDGKAYARDAAGELRALRAGDNLLQGELLVTAEGSTAELALLDGSLLLVNDVTELAMTRDLVADLASGADESAADDETVGQVLAALEGGEDLSEVLEAPAAGAQTLASEGHDYVRLARILEETSEFSGIVPEVAVEEEVVIDQEDLIPVDAIDDADTTEEGQPVTINVEANDAFPEGSLVVAVSDPENGVAVINPDDTVTYTPNPGFTGTDTFTYTAVSPDGNGGDTAVVTIIVTGDPEPPPPPPELPSIAIGDDIVFEGELAQVTVTLSSPSDVPVTVAFVTADDTATVTGGDYNPESGTITFAPGQTEAIVQVQTNQDTLAEGTEQLTVNLSDPSNATIADPTGVIIIEEQGTPPPPPTELPSIEIGDQVVFEGQVARVSVTLSEPSDVPVTVNFVTTDGTATVSGGDYDPESGTLTFAPGVTEVVIEVDTNTDNLNESSETFDVVLSDPGNATIADETGTVTIRDAFTPPPQETVRVGISGSTVEEGALASFTVTLDNASDVAQTVNLSTINGTADASDFVNSQFFDAGGNPISSTLVFAVGETSKEVFVQTIDNDPPLGEPLENYTVSANLVGGNTATAHGGITDSDLPSVSISGSTVEEGALAMFTVTLSQASGSAETVNLSAITGTADATDFNTAQFFDAGGNPISSSLVFAAGETTKDVYIQTIDNDPPLGEPLENYTVEASLVGGNTASAQGGITDSDVASVSITGSTVEEGALALFTVSLSQASAMAETVNLSAITGTADASDFDTTQFYDAVGNPISSTLVFAPGETSKEVYVQTIDNDPPLGEPLENYTVEAALVGGNTASAQGGITDSDSASVSITGSTVEEGDLALFTVTLSQASAMAETVNLSAITGTADATDFNTAQFFDAGGNPISSALVFAAGETSKEVYVQTINNDPPVGEPLENYTVEAALVGGNTAIAQGGITDSDVASVSITGSTVEEGALALFTVSLNQASAVTETVNLSAITGTADASDFNTTQFFDAGGNPISSTLVFAAGETSKEIYVQTINNDPPVGEPLENYTVEAALVGGNTASAQGGITDSDVASVSITGSTVEEGELALFTVSLSQASAVAETVNLSAIAGTADASDFNTAQFFDAGGNPISSALVFAAGETSKEVYVQTINNDPPVGEPLENYTVEAALVGGNTASAQGGITDSDVASVSITGSTVEEGDLALFTVSLSQASAVAETVNLSAITGTADATDFNTTQFFDAGGNPISSALVFAAGETSKEVYVQTINNDPPVGEPLENYTVEAALVGGNTASAQGGITDSDVASVSITGSTVEEGELALFTVSLSQASAVAETVNLSAITGTADATDFNTAQFFDAGGNPISSALVFAAGETSKEVYVQTINNDPPVGEPLENYTVEAALVGGNTASAQGGITDSDVASVSITGSTVEEGELALFTVSLSQASAVTETVNLSAITGTADASDFNTAQFFDAGGNPISSALVFAAGETSKQVYVQTINNDPPVGEPLENYTVEAALVGGNTASAQGGITDSDVASVSITGSTVEEGELALFTVSLSQASAVAETVNLSAIAGTADASDFNTAQFFDAGGNPISSALVFAAGETSKEVYVQTINNDPPVGEPLENYTVEAALVGGNTASAQGGITDSDVPTISINSVSAVEGQPLVFTISLSQPAAAAVTVSWATALDAAGVDPAELSDYVSASNSVTFAPGESTKTLSIATVVDAINEANETMQVVLSSAVGGVIASGVGIGTILDDDNPTAATVTATVDEDGLVDGIGDAAAGDAADANADADNNEATFSGTLVADFGEDAPGTFDFASMDGQSAVLGAESISYAWDALSNTLTATTTSGDRIGTDLFEVSVNPSNGQFAVNLLTNALHTVSGTEDDLTAALNYTVTDGSGSTAAGTLNVVIDDDLPTVVGSDDAVEELNFNLVVVLDLSRSMLRETEISDGQGGFLTRFEASVEAINRLMDSYDSLGNVSVRLVTFASGASGVGDVWTDVDTARTQLAGLTPNGLTNYLAALETVSGISSIAPGSYGDGIWNDAGRFTMEGVQNVSYFASDGNPTAGGALNSTRQALWEGFLDDNDILSYAIGLGSSININNLNPVAYDGREAGTDIDALPVTEFAQLTDTIVATVPPVMGNLVGAAGADGAAALAVTIDGTTFTYDVIADSLSVSGALAFTFDEAENLLTVTSAKNGIWQVEMDTGSFMYQADIESTGTDSLSFALTDGDGDTASDSLVIQLLAEPGGQPGAPGPDNDALIGTSGNDVFAWELSDLGSAGNPEQDSVLYFGTEGDDVLDLSDVLIDATPGSGGDIGDLDQFINISSDGTDSFLQISSSGGFTDGNFDPSAVDQSITLVGVDLGNDSTQAIRDLLSSGQLQTDS